VPKAFEHCVQAGGRVRTEQLGGGRYRHVCWLGKRKYPGHVKHKQEKGKR